MRALLFALLVLGCEGSDADPIAEGGAGGQSQGGSHAVTGGSSSGGAISKGGSAGTAGTISQGGDGNHGGAHIGGEAGKTSAGESGSSGSAGAGGKPWAPLAQWSPCQSNGDCRCGDAVCNASPCSIDDCARSRCSECLKDGTRETCWHVCSSASEVCGFGYECTFFCDDINGKLNLDLAKKCTEQGGACEGSRPRCVR